MGWLCTLSINGTTSQAWKLHKFVILSVLGRLWNMPTALLMGMSNYVVTKKENYDPKNMTRIDVFIYGIRSAFRHVGMQGSIMQLECRSMNFKLGLKKEKYSNIQYLMYQH